MIFAKLTESRWLRREFEVYTPEGLFKVAYIGDGMGYEEVLVNGEVACHKSSHLWYAPEFYFSIGEYSALIEVRISIWMTIRYFSLEVDGLQIYSEGQETR
jgi:hypothetical protein